MKFDEIRRLQWKIEKKWHHKTKNVEKPLKTFKTPIPAQKFLTNRRFNSSKTWQNTGDKKNHNSGIKKPSDKMSAKKNSLSLVRSLFQPPSSCYLLKRPKVRDPKWQTERKTRKQGMRVISRDSVIFCCCPSQIELIFVQIQLFKTVLFYFFYSVMPGLFYQSVRNANKHICPFPHQAPRLYQIF